MRTLLAPLVLALLPALAAAQGHPLRAGTLTVDFPGAWDFKGSSGQRAEGHGPDGEHVILTYRVLHPGAPADVVAQHWVVIRNFARDEMPGLAAGKDTQVLRAVTQAPRQDARVEYSSVSKRSREGRDAYFLQYFLGSSRTIAYFVVEGDGDATQAAARFEKILATQRWQE
jgi:hypothetical protein